MHATTTHPRNTEPAGYSVATGVGMTGRELHRALCAALGIENERGSRRLVSEALGVHYARYRGLTGPGPEPAPLGSVMNLCRRAGVAVLVLPDGPERGRVEVTHPDPIVAAPESTPEA